jgi:hypothetical protein
MFPSSSAWPLKLTTYNVLRRELVSPRGVQRKEDARNLTSLRARRRSPGGLEQPPGGWRRNNFYGVLRCVPRDRRTLAEKNRGGARCRTILEIFLKIPRNKVWVR